MDDLSVITQATGSDGCEGSTTTFSIEDNTLQTGIIEANNQASSHLISIQNPRFFSRLSQQLHRKALCIDKCHIHYTPMCPINSTDTVEIQILDNRLKGEENIQARFAFPVTCPVTIIYYRSSFTSTSSRQCPWSAAYSLQNSNIKTGMEFCRIKASLAFSMATFPNQITFKAPSIAVRSNSFSPNDVDIWHCDKQKQSARLSRSLSTSDGRNVGRLSTGLGQYASDYPKFTTGRLSLSSSRQEESRIPFSLDTQNSARPSRERNSRQLFQKLIFDRSNVGSATVS